MLILAVDLLKGRDCLTEGLRASPWPVLEGTVVEEVGRPGLLSKGGLRGIGLVAADNGFLTGVAMWEDEQLLTCGSGEDVLEKKRETTWNRVT